MSETRRRTVLVPVRMTPAEAALLDEAVKVMRARGRGTVLREVFLREEGVRARHVTLAEIALQGRKTASALAWGPHPAPPAANAPGPAQDRPGAPGK